MILFEDVFKKEMFIQGSFKKDNLVFSKKMPFKKEGHGIHDQRRQRDQWQELSKTLRGSADQRRTSGISGYMISETSKRPANQWFLKDGAWYCIWLNAQLWTCGGASQVGIQHRRSAEVPSCTFETFGANCNLFWCIRWSSLLYLSVRTMYTAVFNIRTHLWKIR